jgi:hypothetical protein
MNKLRPHGQTSQALLVEKTKTKGSESLSG